MIPVRLLNGTQIYINAELVETVATVPDTIVTLSTGRKFVVRTEPQAILEAILEYRRRVHLPPRTDCRLPIADCRSSTAGPAEIRNQQSAIANRKSQIANGKCLPGLCPLEGHKPQHRTPRDEDIVRTA